MSKADEVFSFMVSEWQRLGVIFTHDHDFAIEIQTPTGGIEKRQLFTSCLQAIDFAHDAYIRHLTEGWQRKD